MEKKDLPIYGKITAWSIAAISVMAAVAFGAWLAIQGFRLITC